MSLIRTRIGFLSAGLLALAVGIAVPAEAATRFVATTGDDNGVPNNCLNLADPCKTITHALTQGVASDTIQIAAGTYDTANGETFPLVIDKDLTLTGAGAPTTIIDADGTTLVILINAGVTAAISDVTITGGSSSCGGPSCATLGGGLDNVGTLTVTNSTVSGNTASCSEGTWQAQGGGLDNVGTLTLTNVTVSGNTASCTGVDCFVRGGGLLALRRPTRPS